MSVCHCVALVKGPHHKQKKSVEGALHAPVFLWAFVDICFPELSMYCVKQKCERE